MKLFETDEPSEIAHSLIALEERLAKVEALLKEIFEALVNKGQIQEYYSTAEAARYLGKKPYTVREWCRLGRVKAIRAKSGRGYDPEWRLTHDELLRIKREGLFSVTSYKNAS